MKGKRSHKGLILGIVLAFVALISAGAYIFGIFSNLTAESPVKYWVQAVNNGDYNKYLQTLPPQLRKAYKKLDEDKDFVKNIKSDNFNGNEVKYEILGKEKCSAEELDYIKSAIKMEVNAMANEAGIKSKDIDITEAYNMQVKLTYGEDSKEYTFYVYKSGFKWYLFPVSLQNFE